MANHKEFHSANIIDTQWDDFKLFVTNNYKEGSAYISSFSAAEKNFVRILFKDGSGAQIEEYSETNAFWVRMLRDTMANNMNLCGNVNRVKELNEKTVADRQSFLSRLIKDAIIEFQHYQQPARVRRYTI